MSSQNIILTGVERSGTTLACHLLNKLPDVVALHEPMKVRKFPKARTRAQLVDTIDRFYAQMRNSILKYGEAISQHVDGAVPDNSFDQAPSESGLRNSVDVKGIISVDKKLNADFLLCVKHLGPFTAILQELTTQFPCFAIVRNPLAILASWNSVDLPVRDGRQPAIERMMPELASALDGIADRFERQMYLLSWHFSHYAKYLEPSHVLKYEEMIASGGKSLSVLCDAAAELDEPLQSRNKNKLYDHALMETLGRRLADYDGAFWNFYTKDQVAELAAA